MEEIIVGMKPTGHYWKSISLATESSEILGEIEIPTDLKAGS